MSAPGDAYPVVDLPSRHLFFFQEDHLNKRLNLDPKTVEGFGEEWTAYDQTGPAPAELESIFRSYFEIFPWTNLPESPSGFDLGCGSGRWARLVAPRVGHLHCIDASEKALVVARRNLSGLDNCSFHCASVDDIPLPDASMDFGYSLGVLHHVPDTREGIAACVAKLKPGAPFLLYLYYAFDNRPVWFRHLWRISDIARIGISKLPHAIKLRVTQAIAAGVYWPLARTSRLLERYGRNVSSFPLSAYRNTSFYTMRTDALDRFGTRLEQRFTAAEIEQMMREAGLTHISFGRHEPFWCAVGYRAA
jgi:SAM-dependent methyltransferase